MRVIWANRALKDFRYWEQTDPKVASRIKQLIDDIVDRDPFTGIGKPEPLKQRWRGFWSRRIDAEHRLVYRVTGNPRQLEIAQCRFHYK